MSLIRFSSGYEKCAKWLVTLMGNSFDQQLLCYAALKDKADIMATRQHMAESIIIRYILENNVTAVYTLSKEALKQEIIYEIEQTLLHPKLITEMVQDGGLRRIAQDDLPF